MLCKDQSTIISICDLLKQKNEEDHAVVNYNKVTTMALTILFSICNEANNSKPMLIGCMMENGAIGAILLHLPKLYRDNDGDLIRTAVSVLNFFIISDFKDTRYFERSIKWKGDIFSDFPAIFKTVERLDMCKNERLYKSVFFIFESCLRFDSDINYCKSMMRSHIKDGTIFKLFKLISDLMNYDGEFVKDIIIKTIHIFSLISQCDQNTVHEKPNHGLDAERWVLKELIVKNLTTIAKDDSAFQQALCNMSEYDEKDRELFLREKLFKQLTSHLAVELRSKKMNCERMTYLVQMLNIMYHDHKDSIIYEDFRCLKRHFPLLIDSQKHSVDFLKKSLLLTGYLIDDSGLFKEEDFRQLRASGFIALLVQNAKIFHGATEGLLVWGMISVCFSPEPDSQHRISLEDISQILPGIPLCIELMLQNECDDDLKYNIRRLLLIVVNNLLHIKNKGCSRIDSVLRALEECDFVSGIGKAVILIEDTDAEATHQLVYTILGMNELMDSRALMEKLLDFLPALAKKQQCNCDYIDANGLHLEYQIAYILRKAAAYVLEDIDPTFFAETLVWHITWLWNCLRISGKKKFFSSDPWKTEENVEISYMETFIDILRVTWTMVDKYPELICSHIAKFNPSLFGENPGLQETCSTMSALIIEIIISYLDHSQDYSLNFLRELSSLIKDLSHEAVSSEKSKLLFSGLPRACERFLKVNNDKVTNHDLKHFINVYYASLD